MNTLKAGVVLVALGKAVLWMASVWYIEKTLLKEYILPEIKGDDCEDFLSAEKELCARKMRLLIGMMLWTFYTYKMSRLLLNGATKNSVWRCTLWLCLTVIEISLVTVGFLKVLTDEDTLKYGQLVGVWYAVHACFAGVVLLFKIHLEEEEVKTLLETSTELRQDAVL